MLLNPHYLGKKIKEFQAPQGVKKLSCLGTHTQNDTMEQPTTRPPIKKKTRTIFATPICTQFTFYYTSKSHVHNERSSNTSKSHAHNERSSVSQIKIHKRINKFH